MFAATGIAPKPNTTYLLRGCQFQSSVGRGENKVDLFKTDTVYMRKDPKYPHLITSY
jgi:hypothetical protein